METSSKALKFRASKIQNSGEQLLRQMTDNVLLRVKTGIKWDIVTFLFPQNSNRLDLFSMVFFSGRRFPQSSFLGYKMLSFFGTTIPVAYSHNRLFLGRRFQNRLFSERRFWYHLFRKDIVFLTKTSSFIGPKSSFERLVPIGEKII